MSSRKGLRDRCRRWFWKRTAACCCMVERLETWESMDPGDWEERLMSPWDSTDHGDEFGHLISLDIMQTWQQRGDFLRALNSEDLLGQGSMLNPHPVLNICLGFRNCELSSGKDYSCYCRVREIFRGKKQYDKSVFGNQSDCESIYDGILASYWVRCVAPMMTETLWDLSSLRHKRSNFSVKKHLTNDVIMSDPIHMMYVHIEGMIPQFGPFMFEVWRRNQGLQMGFTGDFMRHGVHVIISHPRRQHIEVELRKLFPNKPIRERQSVCGRRRLRKGQSVVGASSSSVLLSTVPVGHVADILKQKLTRAVPYSITGSSTDANQSALTSTLNTEVAAIPNSEVDEITGPLVFESRVRKSSMFTRFRLALKSLVTRYTRRIRKKKHP